MAKQGFDNGQYLKLQSQHIQERIAQFGGKLYLEFGGKLFDDFHASRVLPGFEPDSKIRMLAQMKDKADHLRQRRAPAHRRLPVHGPVRGQRGGHPVRRTDRRRRLPEAAGVPGGEGVPPLPHRRLPPQHCEDRLRRGLRAERLRGDQPPPGGGHRPRPRQRQDGHLSQPALPRVQAGSGRRVRQV